VANNLFTIMGSIRLDLNFFCSEGYLLDKIPCSFSVVFFQQVQSPNLHQLADITFDFLWAVLRLFLKLYIREVFDALLGIQHFFFSRSFISALTVIGLILLFGHDSTGATTSRMSFILECHCYRAVSSMEFTALSIVIL